MLLDFYTFLSYPFREYDIDFDRDYLFSSNILIGFAIAKLQLNSQLHLHSISISTPSQFNSSKSWVGVMPYIWFVPPPPPPPYYFSELQN